MAKHLGPGEAIEQLDYHHQYDQDDFAAALEATRRRQSKRIVELIRAQVPSPECILDFGAGRGWFLDACREGGMGHRAGADTSAVAIEGVRRRGAEGLLLEPPKGNQWNLGLERLSFRPRLLTLLDVVEHFASDHARALMTHLIEQLLPELELVVVKVPVSNGLFHRMAEVLSTSGVHQPLEQLYQCGTWPPHFSYFSLSSAAQFLSSSGLSVVGRELDPDFEPDQLMSRIATLRRVPSGIGNFVGRAALGVSRRLNLQDSVIFVARPASRA